MSRDDQDRQFAPSQRRLDEARKNGDIPRSQEVTAAAAYAGMVIAVTVGGGLLTATIGNSGMFLLAQADRLLPQVMADARLPPALFSSVLLGLAPLFTIPAAVALLAILATRSLVFTPTNLMPKLSRISLIANAGQKFGRQGLVGFLRSLAKLVVVSLILWLFLRGQADLIMASVMLAPGQVSGYLADILIGFLLLMTAVAATFGAVDFLWQWFEHIRRNRMSRQDMTDEAKDSEGDPHMRGLRRQRAREIATNKMLQDVAKADVVVVNPTHYAVALRWNRLERGAPICVAKGVDEIAARIRERAMLAGVPVHSDPPTARALYATVDIGARIRPEHYLAIAAAIRFSDRIRKRQRAWK